MSLLNCNDERDELSKPIILNIVRKYFERFFGKYGKVYFNQLIDNYTDDDWDWMINNPGKVHFYTWFTYCDVRIYISATDIRPDDLEWGYEIFRPSSCYRMTLYKIFKYYEKFD